MSVPNKKLCQFKVIAETNAGYANSEINVRLRVFCVEKINFNEFLFNNPDEMLRRFSTSRGTYENRR